jgi:3-hydroxybutyryl-CoA dehydrogenase
MRIVIIADDRAKKELIAGLIDPNPSLTWATEPGLIQDADVYIDLLFEQNRHHKVWQELKPNFLIVSSVIESGLPFIRINAWPGMLERGLIEASGGSSEERAKAEAVFTNLNKKIEWVTDQPGFITPRIISSIINEAYFTIAEGVTDKKNIDLAMKLGTNYPYGPFEWGEIIGLKNIYNLLEELSKSEQRYSPSSLLKEEANS